MPNTIQTDIESVLESLERVLDISEAPVARCRLLSSGFGPSHTLNTETRRKLDEVVLGEYQRVVKERGGPADGGNGQTRSQQIAGKFLGEKYWTEEDGDDE